MRIKEWSWKNYKSYGNVKQRITLNDKGELILILGQNGAGKSSFLEILDLALFGQVLNKQGKRLPQKNLPNRVNNHLDVNVIFETDEEINITRTIENAGASLNTKLLTNKIPYGKANKIDDKILEKIGFDYKTYKSFISMDINNFKNFISLTPEEKRILLDKLFNLEIINDLNKILKQLQKNNDLSFNTINSEIKIYRDSILELNNTISKVLEKNKDNKEEQLLELKNVIDINKNIFDDLSIKKQELEEFLSEINTGISEIKSKVRDIDRDILDINKMINLYNSGKCPTCHTELKGELNLLPVFEERLEKTLEIKNKLLKKITKGEIAFNDTNNDLKNTNNEYNKLYDLLLETKSKIKVLKNTEDTDITEFNKNVESLNIKLSDKENEYLEIQKLKYVYDILSPIWSELGIKRDIIESIIDPLNEFIAEDLIHLKTRFKVELDNNFDAHIYEWNQEIDPDTLSTGETKKINLIIMLAYIKMLRMKRDINVLFLDEVFASIDIIGIDDILILFKKFANDRNVNIFLVHHSELKEHFFDRIISIKKNTFSYIEEKLIN